MSPKKWLSVWIAVLVVFAFAAPALAQEGTGVTVEARQRVNVRSGPGTLYTVIGQLAAGSSADITGRDSAENDWLRIDFGGQEGWVAFSVVDVTGDPNTAEIVGPGETAAFIETAAQQNAQARLNVVYRTRMNVNLRATPNLNAQVLTVIPANTDVQPNARTVQSNWLRVTYNGQTGWIVTGMAARVSGDLRTVPVATQ